MALTQVPILNASYDEGKAHIYQEINVSMAIALEDGLIAPVIKNCDQKPLAQIAREAKELVNGATKARCGRTSMRAPPSPSAIWACWASTSSRP